MHKVQQTFHEDDIQCILEVRIPQNQVQDKVVGMATTDRKYTAKSRYHFLYDKN